MKPERNDMPRADPLIDDVRGVRQSISNRHGNDVDRLYDHLRVVQRQYAGRIVSRKRPRVGAPALRPLDRA